MLHVCLVYKCCTAAWVVLCCTGLLVLGVPPVLSGSQIIWNPGHKDGRRLCGVSASTAAMPVLGPLYKWACGSHEAHVHASSANHPRCAPGCVVCMGVLEGMQIKY